jgi:hypothetical protein
MSTQVQYRRGSGAQNNSFVGALAEITVDTTNGTLRVHDGITAGGSNIATVSYVDNAIGSLSANSISDGTSSVTIIATNGNIRANVGGSTVQLLSSGGANVTGFVSATGNVSGGNLTTAGLISATGNITGGNLSGTSIVGTLTTAAQTNITSVGTLTALTVTGNVTGGNLTTAGLISATGNITGGNLSGTSIVGTLTTAAQTNITSVGTLTALTVTGNVTGGNLITAGLVSLSSITKTGSNGVGNIGSSTSVFDTVFAKATSAQYADVAEKYLADQDYAPGTVVEIGGTAEVTETTTYASVCIAGVVSTDPALIMNSGALGDHPVAVALLGRVPCRVAGVIRRGDLLCSSTVPGHAVSMPAGQYRPGAVIGKALADHNDAGPGMIEVLVGRL